MTSQSTAAALFSGLTITASATDITRAVPNFASKLSVCLSVTAISGPSTAATFSVQWSPNGGDWYEANPPDLIGTTTVAVGAIQLFEVKASYWRLRAVLTGALPSVTLTGNVIYLG